MSVRTSLELEEMAREESTLAGLGYGAHEESNERDRLLGDEEGDSDILDGEHFEHVTPLEEQAFKRKKKGYYVYSTSLIVFDQIAVVLFLPLVLEALAKSKGFLAPDHIIPCIQDPSSNPSPPTDPHLPPTKHPRCSVWLFGTWIDTASVSLLVSSTAMLLGAFFVIGLTRKAGKTQSRTVLTATTLVGSAAAVLILIVPLESRIWWFAAPLNVTTNVCYSICGVVFGSHLVALGRTAERIEEEQGGRKSPTAETVAEVRKASPTSHIASRAFAFGYFAGTASLLAMLALVWATGATTLSSRLATAISGLYWAGVGTVGSTLLYGPSSKVDHEADERHWTEGFRTVWEMIKCAPDLQDTFVYLICWILFSDGFSTFGAAAILFGRTTLGLSSSALTLVALIVPIFAVIGALVWRQLQHSYWKCTNRVMLQRILFAASLVPAYGLFGAVVEKYGWSWGGITTAWELYFCAAFFGFILGGYEVYARALLSELIPVSHASQFFGMFAITSKSSAFIGPLFLSVITTKTGSLRQGFWFVLFTFLLPTAILLFVNPERGRREADAWGEKKMRELERQERR
ncbi:MFS general substrate transporter [Atractiella rhizophila]|nr:MFS general substrate transporter [Atractiella rhizophila]